MAIDKQELWNNQRIKNYLEQEVEFADAFAAQIAQAHPDWDTKIIKCNYEAYFFGPFLSTITDWRKIISPKLEENPLQEDLEEASDDPTDPTYQEIRMPTSLYQWGYFYLKFVPAKYNMANEEQLHELVVRMFRTQQYDAELLGLGSQHAYPSAENLVSPPVFPTPGNRTRAGPALIHQLPPEILSDIFLRARDGWLYLPLVVSHVDSRFRAIAESTAVLWTTIDVYLSPRLVSLYLQRSGTALLDVRIDLRGLRIWKDVDSLLPPFFTLVADHRERIASLSMSALIEEFVDEMVKGMMIEPGSTYPQLRRLDTGYVMWVGRRNHYELLNCPVVVPPRLQELSLRGCRSRDWIKAFPEPLARLKSLHLVNNMELFLTDILIVLANLPNLETLVLQDCAIKQAALTASPAVTLPNLTTLQYVTLDHDSIASMNQAFLSPKLTSLKLWWDDCSDREVQATWHHQAQALIAMLSANPQLENLDLCNCAMEHQGWRIAFSKARSLKSLRLRWCESESNNLAGLLELCLGEDVEQDLLPYLEHLVLENVFHLTTKYIREIITRRPGLRFIELRGWDGSNVEEEDVQFIRESTECFILETFCNGSGLLEGEDEGSEEGSSSGTPSEGSWLSGDDEIHG